VAAIAGDLDYILLDSILAVIAAVFAISDDAAAARVVFAFVVVCHTVTPLLLFV
jgi:hypothetical protein